MGRPRPPASGDKHLESTRWFDQLADRLTGDPDTDDPLADLEGQSGGIKGYVDSVADEAVLEARRPLPQTNAFLPDDPAEAYPEGFTFFTGAVPSDWTTSGGTAVITFKEHENRVIQFFYQTNWERIEVRWWNAGTSSWTERRTLAVDTDIADVLAAVDEAVDEAVDRVAVNVAYAEMGVTLYNGLHGGYYPPRPPARVALYRGVIDPRETDAPFRSGVDLWSPSDPVTDPSSLIYLPTDFALHDIGSGAAGLTSRWATMSLEIVDELPGSLEPIGDRALKVSADVRGSATVDAAGDDIADSEQLALIVLDNTEDDGQHLLRARVSGESSGEASAYYCLIDHAGRLGIAKYVDGASDTGLLDPRPGLNPVAGVKLWVRFRVEGDQISAKLWPDGDTEPDWQGQVTDTDLTVGGVGFGQWRSTRWVDYYAVAVDGAIAPMPV